VCGFFNRLKAPPIELGEERRREERRETSRRASRVAFFDQIMIKRPMRQGREKKKNNNEKRCTPSSPVVRRMATRKTNDGHSSTLCELLYCADSDTPVAATAVQCSKHLVFDFIQFNRITARRDETRGDKGGNWFMMPVQYGFIRRAFGSSWLNQMGDSVPDRGSIHLSA
jgi:hypothetical protein